MRVLGRALALHGLAALVQHDQQQVLLERVQVLVGQHDTGHAHHGVLAAYGQVEASRVHERARSRAGALVVAGHPGGHGALVVAHQRRHGHVLVGVARGEQAGVEQPAAGGYLVDDDGGAQQLDDLLGRGGQDAVHAVGLLQAVFRFQQHLGAVGLAGVHQGFAARADGERRHHHGRDEQKRECERVVQAVSCQGEARRLEEVVEQDDGQRRGQDTVEEAVGLERTQQHRHQVDGQDGAAGEPGLVEREPEHRGAQQGQERGGEVGARGLEARGQARAGRGAGLVAVGDDHDVGRAGQLRQATSHGLARE